MDPASAGPEASAASLAMSLLLELAAAVPASYYLLGSLVLVSLFLYSLLEFHLVGSVIRGCRGDRVRLTFNPDSALSRHVVSSCRTLRGRYLATPWLASPHLQTAFLSFFGNSPAFSYRRQVFPVSHEEAVALDWLLASDVVGYSSNTKTTISQDDTTPIVVAVPGLIGDSTCPYVKHLVYKIAKRGWNAVVCNHRGLGGIPIKSECYYNAGLTEDIRKVVNHLHKEYPRAPLFAVGMSMGANILVKYLGEDGEGAPVDGAASICSPWDLVICDRFLNRNLVQRVYNWVLAKDLKGYAQLNQKIYSKLVDWEGIMKSHSVRDFDNNATCVIMNYETVDTYYRRSSSASVVSNVSVPLLCVNALDDPVCTKEVIPWDECRANKNIVLATTTHGGHLAFFKGLTASSLWWVEAVDEFLRVLHSSPLTHEQKRMNAIGLNSSKEPSISKVPHGGVTEYGSMTATGNEGADFDRDRDLCNGQIVDGQGREYTTVIAGQEDEEREANKGTVQENGKDSGQEARNESYVSNIPNIFSVIRRNQLSKQNTRSIWSLAHIMIVSSWWPLVGVAFLVVFKRKLKGVLPSTVGR